MLFQKNISIIQLLIVTVEIVYSLNQFFELILGPRIIGKVATIRFEPSVLCFLRLSRNRITINATTHTFLERSFRDLSKNVLVVALIVNRFRDKRQKHQHRASAQLVS